jgi:thioesterase domain-containing protein/acyl carrier protein
VYLNKHEDLAPYAASLTARLKEGASLLDLSATLAERRRRRAIVRCFVVESSQEWAEQLARPVTADDVADVRLPRFTADELASIASELPAMGYSSDDKDTPTSEALAAALARLLDTMGVFAAPDVVAQNEFPANCDGDRISAPQLSAYLVRDTSDADSTAGSPLRRLLQFVARVHTKFELDVSALYAGTGWRSGSLPAYPLTPVRHWIDNEAIPQPGGHAEAAIARKPIHDDQLVEEIVEIWKQGIGDDSVTSETTFVDTGADSLTAIEILDRINRTFGTSIPVSASLARVTPSEIASQMLGRELRSSAPWVSYVRYRSPDAKTVFLVHPAGGSTFCYSALSRHVMKHVNLCAIDLPEGYEGYGSLTDLARRYADVIRTYQPNGPYLVGGYSFGGNLAHELARELESRNCAVEAVVMFDSHPPEAYNAYVGSDFDYVGAFPTLVASYFKPELIDVASREGRGIIRLDAAVDVVRRLGILSDSLKNDDIERFFDRWVFTHRLLKAHEPAAGVAAPLFMFVARDDEPAVLLDKLKIYSVSKDSWKKYFSGPVTSIPVDGDHFTMFGNASHLKALAGKFDTVLHDFAMQRA